MQVLSRFDPLLIKVIFHHIVQRASIPTSSSTHVLLKQAVKGIVGEFADLQEGATVLQSCKVHGHVSLNNLIPAKLVSIAKFKQSHISA